MELANEPRTSLKRRKSFISTIDKYNKVGDEIFLLSHFAHNFHIFSNKFFHFNVVSGSAEPTLLEKRITDAFDVFDNARSHEVDVRELGTIIRSLGKESFTKIVFVSLIWWKKEFFPNRRLRDIWSWVAGDSSPGRGCREQLRYTRAIRCLHVESDLWTKVKNAHFYFTNN